MDVRANGKISEVNAAERMTAGAQALALPSGAAQPYRGYWICQAAGWGLVCAFNSAFVLFSMPQALPSYLLIYGVASIAGVGLSHVWRGILKRRGWLEGTGRTPWLPLAGFIGAFGISLMMVTSIMFFVVRPSGMASGYAWVPSAIIFWVLTFVVWTGFYTFVQSRRRAVRLEAERLRLEVLAKDAELRALQAQINPHFYFNSLNSLRALIFENPSAAAGMVDQLAGLMRYTLTSSEAKTVSLQKEMGAVRAYLAIEKIRFEERLRVNISIDPGCEQQPIPPMTVQALVENAVKHGVERSPGGSDIDISITRAGDRVQVRVTNSGTLTAHGDSTRMGFINSQKRLALLSGESATLQLLETNGSVTATLDLPVA
jgi:Histidine kinase